jgi:hypothetical protein
MNTATMARELGLPSATLDGFIAGKNSLPPETLAAIVRDLFHGAAVFDPAIDRLRSSNTTEPVSLGVRPDPFNPRTSPYYFAGAARSRSPQPVKPSKQSPKAPRPGWV